MSATSEAPERLVFLHGFTQTHHHWHRCAELVATRVADSHGRCPELVLPDLPGHGLSHADTTGIDDAAGELARRVGTATLVGYSMGGRVALHTALAPSSRVERIVLIGATAGLADDTERAERRQADDLLAERVERIGVAEFLRGWLALPLFATLPDDPVGLDHRRRNTAAGLAHSLRTAGTGAQRSLWGELGRIDVPVLLLAGERDAKFTALAEAMAAELPRATVDLIADAGHAAHSERPDEVATAIADWLTATA